MNQLMWYYADLEKKKCYHAHNDIPDFDNQEKACATWRRFAKYVNNFILLIYILYFLNIIFFNRDILKIKDFVYFY